MNRIESITGFALLLSALACPAQGPISWEQRAPIGTTFIKEIAGRIWVGGTTNLTSADLLSTQGLSGSPALLRIRDPRNARPPATLRLLPEG